MKSRNKNNLILALLLLLVFILAVFLIRPTLLGIKKISQEMTAEDEKIASLEEKIKNLENSKDFFEKAEGNLEKTDSFFVDARLPIDLIGFLEKSAQDSEVSLKISSVSEEKKLQNAWPHINFQTTASGLFPAVSEFLDKLESGPYLIEIQSLSMNFGARQGSRSKSNVITANLSLKVFSK